MFYIESCESPGFHGTPESCEPPGFYDILEQTVVVVFHADIPGDHARALMDGVDFVLVRMEC